ncbi:MAG: GNAT family N-acetyltransferase [Lachnospiraceae bacterium]|nr:GNAT family N-acetyltransferase [Lachnospiraceae bacterium]
MSKKEDYQIRHALLSDLDAVAELESLCFSKADGATRESFEERLKVFPDHFWLLEKDGILVSMVNGMVTHNDILEDEMYTNAKIHDEQGGWQMIFGVETRPDYQRRGFAEMLLKQVIADVRKQKRKGLVLTCKEHMVHYYEKFGVINEGLSESTHGGAEWYHMRYQMKIEF